MARTEPGERLRAVVAVTSVAMLVFVVNYLLDQDIPSALSPGYYGRDWTELRGKAQSEVTVESFQEQCEKGVSQWRVGQLNYPKELVISTNGSATYNAAIDVRNVPLPADAVIEVQGTARSEPISVKCIVAAQLVPVGDHLTVGGASNEQWLSREFTPLGVVEWSWTVTAKKPVDQELELIIRPAMLAEGKSVEGPFYGASSEASLTTQVRVEATPIDRVSYWFEVQWPLVVGTAGLLGLGITAFWQWIQKLIDGARKTTVNSENKEATARSKKKKQPGK